MNVSAATESANNISSHGSQLKLQLSKTQELYTRETSIAVKQTAENLLNLITSTAKGSEDQQAVLTPTPFLEFVSIFSLASSNEMVTRKYFLQKSKSEEQIASIGGILTTVGCIIDNE